jgi:hypothetical protein
MGLFRRGALVATMWDSEATTCGGQLQAAGCPRGDAAQWRLLLTQESSNLQRQVCVALLSASRAHRESALDPKVP